MLGVKKKVTNAVEAIKLYESGELRSLTAKQVQIMERCQKAYHMLFESNSIAQVARKIQEEDPDINSISGAFKAVNQALEIYGNPLQSRKQALRFLNAERQYRLLDLQESEIKRKKEAGKDLGEDIEIASRINDRISKLLKLDQDDPDLPDPSLFERTTVAILNIGGDIIQEYPDVIDIPVERIEFNDSPQEEEEE
ncbi:hypothetical protein [Flammeovirga aprica]|uniref:Uncharacterized protein n=1 Tax=Flammeovirga aprica JL-4 TaxID=694437 RepID=A0A7X9RSK7_9BACT|nr:hypothetical protein [Flammeovirga aprica]NME67201.1 hypothetical protein [Flammeovirga aprica JL-4]